MDLSGPSFVTLLVSNLEASERFYREKLGFPLAEVQPKGNARAFDIKPCGLALRLMEPESPKAAAPGAGILLWFHTTDSKALHDQLKASEVDIAIELADSPFGKTFSFSDPDGYILGVYDGA
jgi:catechol 2,3-dioxygenase-like lactoylglutathione lyase family enzyme